MKQLHGVVLVVGLPLSEERQKETYMYGNGGMDAQQKGLTTKNRRSDESDDGEINNESKLKMGIPIFHRGYIRE